MLGALVADPHFLLIKETGERREMSGGGVGGGQCNVEGAGSQEHVTIRWMGVTSCLH